MIIIISSFDWRIIENEVNIYIDEKIKQLLIDTYKPNIKQLSIDTYKHNKRSRKRKSKRSCKRKSKRNNLFLGLLIGGILLICLIYFCRNRNR